MEQLHAHPHSICHIIDLLYEKWGQPEASPNSEAMAPFFSVETPLQKGDYNMLCSFWLRCENVWAVCGQTPTHTPYEECRYKNCQERVLYLRRGVDKTLSLHPRRS